MTISDRKGGTLTVPQECDRDYLRWLVQQAIDRSGEKKQDIAAAVGLKPPHVGMALNNDFPKWDYARVKIIEWGLTVRVETVTSISDWSDGTSQRSKTFKLHPPK
jgi:hypothetical protein